MRIVTILRTIGALMCCVGLTMLLPMAVALWYDDSGFLPLALSMLISAFGGLALMLFCKKEDAPLSHREGMSITAFGWITCGLVGSLPYIFSGLAPSPADALFESFSGFTTTGASIFTNVELLPRSLLLWRALTHWLGGMGIIVFSLAILPFLGFGGMQLYKAETPNPVPDRMHPRIQDAAMLLWQVYILLSVLEFVLLLAGGMEAFHAVCYTFSTMATGGFAPHAASAGHFSSPYIHWILVLFMFLGGANFALHFRMLRGNIGAYWRNTEFCAYFGLVVLVSVLVAWNIYGVSAHSLEEAVRHAFFQVVSMCTTTGFFIADYEQWRPFPQALLFLLLFTGGCAGSTSGGVKVLRYCLLFKLVRRELLRIVHPRVVHLVKFGNLTVSGEALSTAIAFLGLYALLYVATSLALAAMGLDLTTAFSASIACLGNTGAAFGSVGPTEHYAHMPVAAKLLLSFVMLLGRLEICTLFILFVPEFWRK